jgi:hypothetical protein
VQGNFIGVDATGSHPLGNLGDGVLLTADDSAPANSYGNQSGYPSAWLGGSWGKIPSGYGNTIAFNGSYGVEVQGVHMVGNPIRGNSIYGNSSGGISVQPALNWSSPLLLSAQSGSNTTVVGILFTTLSYSTTFSVDFYASAAADSLGSAQGRRYLGTVVVTTQYSPQYGRYVAQFTTASASIPLSALKSGESVITATATDYWGSTTAFSNSVTAQ